MKAVIMAGGEGTRLRPMTCSVPKPMVPVANRPIMEHIIELLKKHGITDIAVTLMYLPDEVMEYFGDGTDFGVKLNYFIEETPLGTAGSVANCKNFLNEDFLVISGDALTDVDLTEAINFHCTKKAFSTLILKKTDIPIEYGVVITDQERRISGFLEKPDWSEVISDLANTATINLAEKAGGDIETYLEEYWGSTETLAQILKQYEIFAVERRRLVINELVKGIVRENPALIAAWCCWEPDTLEGNDLQYGGTPGSYPNGRFAPYWFRNGNSVELDILADYDKPGDGDYYLLARNSGQGQLLEPYWYEVGGKSILITSVAIPIYSQDG
ncbi:MAG: NTP transferase domain-containing protein, partial [Clostridiales bacterium]|nr:NTP transferase domain-containing protein [Clostridiales bacterium]